MKILAVDDSPTVLAFMRELFTDTGHEFQSAESGDSALGILRAGSYRPDLILLDWEMPGKDGMETLKEIRSMQADLPVVMVTSCNSVAQISEALQEGANEYVVKPFTAEILLDKIAMVEAGEP